MVSIDNKSNLCGVHHSYGRYQFICSGVYEQFLWATLWRKQVWSNFVLCSLNFQHNWCFYYNFHNNWISKIGLEKLQNCVCLWSTFVCLIGTFDWHLHYCIWAIQGRSLNAQYDQMIHMIKQNIEITFVSFELKQTITVLNN